MQLLSDLFGQSVGYFIAFFQNADFLGIVLAILFGVFWLFFYRPPLFKHDWLWAVLISSAIITLFATAFIQIPLQIAVGKVFYALWTEDQLIRGILFTSLPPIFIGGLVQEGAKLAPVAFYWWRKNKKIDARFGLIAGAIAGAGFGMFEAQWVHNTVFSLGWTWDQVDTQGFLALSPFVERFFMIAFHTATSAFAGYGLARGKGWQFYLIVSVLQGVLNYLTILMQVKILSFEIVETLIALITLGAVGVTLWLLGKKQTIAKEKE